ncbi:MAG: xylulokinase [Candidatus Thorarchaeota archaeon]|nr:MAG: xylulokinase [Candidatus Thorarchaeota archaeon]
MSELVVAIDAGTTGVRSMVFDTAGAMIKQAYEEFPSHFPHPSWVEQNAADWWTSACKTLRDCLADESVKPEWIISASVTNQRETIVPLDSGGNPLRNAIVWQDRRTVDQCDWIRKRVSSDDLYSITGLTVDPYFSAPKILWIKDNEKSLFKETDVFLLVHDFILHKLTDRKVTDYSNASRTLLFDIEQQNWSDRILDCLDIPKEKLPEPIQSGTQIGELSGRAAKETGLASGTPVVAGGGDQQCAALGVGVVREGSIKSTTGTGTFMLAHSDSKRLDSKMRVLCSCHVVPGTYVVEASMFTTGSALRWFRDNLGLQERLHAEAEGRDPYEVMTDAADGVPAGSEGVIHIPHLVGAGAPHWNPRARGIFAGLALGHTRGHLMRSVLEGVAYEIRTNLNVMRELGLSASEMRVTGGAARSETWMQIQADVLNVPVVRTQLEEATALGAAILACHGVGVFKSIAEAAEEMVTPLAPLNPRPENRSVYDEGFERYSALYKATAGFTWGDN